MFIAAVLWLGLWVAAERLGGQWWYLLPGLFTPVALWVPVFFRDPRRDGPRGDQLIIAPADGKVVSVVEVEEPEFVRGRTIRVSVFMNVFNVHVNRHPVTGTVKYRTYHPGRFLNASLDKASSANERASIGISATRGPVLVRQIAGLVARRIVTDPSPGDPVQQGARLGMIRFGSRVDTFFPPGAKPRVKIGDRTVAGVTVIGEWP